MMNSNLCFGIGLGIGFAAGLLLMNNCKPVRNKVAEAQDVVVEKFENKKREMTEKAVKNEFSEDNLSTTGKNTPSAEL